MRRSRLFVLVSVLCVQATRSGFARADNVDTQAASPEPDGGSAPQAAPPSDAQGAAASTSATSVADFDRQATLHEPSAAVLVSTSSTDALVSPWSQLRGELWLGFHWHDVRDNASEFTVERARLGWHSSLDARWGASIEMETRRTADGAVDGGYGVLGDAFVGVLRRADAWWNVPLGEASFTARAGLVEDVWIAAWDDDNPLRMVLASADERFLEWPSTDSGVRLDASWRTLGASVQVTNGEGALWPERNQSKVATGLLSASFGNVTLRAMGRFGTVSPLATRSHRAGAMASWRSSSADVGVAWTKAWGAWLDPATNPMTLSLRTQAKLWRQLHVGGTGQLIWLDESNGVHARAGLGWDTEGPHASSSVWLVADVQRRSGLREFPSLPLGRQSTGVSIVYGFATR